MTLHLLFDLLAYATSGLVGWKVFQKGQPKIESSDRRYFYYTVVIAGAFFGAFLIGTLNTYLSLRADSFAIGKSVLGALVGGILSVELFKKLTGIRGSTGAYFAPSLAAGIAVGRIGCFLSGIEDYTYGIETTLAIGVDFGDGLTRHPVQLYESGTMVLFFLYAYWMYKTRRDAFERHVFYDFVLVYASQRFVWEFLKPYGKVLGPLNVFQIFCGALIVYAVVNLIHRSVSPQRTSAR